jgi:hypothetical protein
MVLKHGDHLVDDLDGGEALPLAFPDPVRVAAALGDCSKLSC